MSNYYKFLKTELNNYAGKFDRSILYIPDFFKLLCSLIDERNIDKEDKSNIYASLAYFVIPNDIIPEDIYGPAGYIDDMFVCVVVLEKLRNKYGIKLLEKHWKEDEDLADVLKLCLQKSKQMLSEKNLIESTLKAANLD